MQCEPHRRRDEHADGEPVDRAVEPGQQHADDQHGELQQGLGDPPDEQQTSGELATSDEVEEVDDGVREDEGRRGACCATSPSMLIGKRRSRSTTCRARQTSPDRKAPPKGNSHTSPQGIS